MDSLPQEILKLVLDFLIDDRERRRLGAYETWRYDSDHEDLDTFRLINKACARAGHGKPTPRLLFGYDEIGYTSGWQLAQHAGINTAMLMFNARLLSNYRDLDEWYNIRLMYSGSRLLRQLTKIL